MEAGLQARRLCAGAVRHLPLLLHHDRIQCLHLRQPAHVSGRLDSVSQNAPSWCHELRSCTPEPSSPQTGRMLVFISTKALFKLLSFDSSHCGRRDGRIRSSTSAHFPDFDPRKMNFSLAALLFRLRSLISQHAWQIRLLFYMPTLICFFFSSNHWISSCSHNCEFFCSISLFWLRDKLNMSKCKRNYHFLLVWCPNQVRSSMQISGISLV